MSNLETTFIYDCQTLIHQVNTIKQIWLINLQQISANLRPIFDTMNGQCKLIVWLCGKFGSLY